MATALLSASNAPAGTEPVVFVVEDDAEVRQSIGLTLGSVDLRVRTFGSGYEFLEFYDPEQSGCLILDMRMPGMTGLQLQQQLAERGWQIPIIFVTGYGEIAAATAALRAGAVDYLPKPFSFQQLLERVQESLALDRRLRHVREQRQAVALRTAALTARELEVMQRLVRGESTKVIAARLGISQKTVDNHRAKVLEKMGVDNAAQLTALCTRGQLGDDNR